MAGLLAENGYAIVKDEKEADVWLLNSCTVKNPAEDHFKNYVTSGLNAGKSVVVAGCVAQSAPKSGYLSGLSIVGVQQIDRVVEVVEESLKGHVVRLLGQRKEGRKKMGGASLSLPKIRKNPLIEIIPISTGCLNQCTYCKTKHARGNLGSYGTVEIVARAQEAFGEGVREIWLTSEDTGAYGRDIGTDLPQLLQQLIPVIPDDCRLRLGMTNPPYIREHMQSMAHIYQSHKIYKFLHMPVQSGSDSVLKDMRREYDRYDFEEIADYLKDKVPGINIATDIICGFPTESEADFTDTLELVRKYKFASLFINQFYPRPGTPAAKMKRIPTQIVKGRSRMLTEVFESYHPYEGREGSVYDVLVTEESSDKRFWVGHNQFYEQILLPKDESLLGKLVQARIISTGKHFMIGEPLNSPSRWFRGVNHVPWQKVFLTTCGAALLISLTLKLRMSR
jgi:threonylcarbamoyladenosine tRNA methylthiotransferase CDKAL1